MSRELNIQKWYLRMIQLAELIATWSKDPSSKCGSVIADGNRVVSTGFNGFPVGVEDTEERLNDRSLKYPIIKHAEANAILLSRELVRGMTLFVSPLLPCTECAGDMIQTGIKRVVFRTPDRDHPTCDVWLEKFHLSKEILDEAGVEIYEISYDDVITRLTPGVRYE